MSTILAIDPGPIESAYALINAETRRPVEVNKIDNHLLRLSLTGKYEHSAIEMIESYGMPVGREVFDTCVWVGRFIEASGGTLKTFARRAVKLHHCHSAAAKDGNVTQALVDRFAPGQSNHGKGTRAEPGWFYGFRADMWQAYALAVMVADRIEEGA